eukprot:c19976_g1_i4.p1 GENE.c19976_g1_i4~~c19976_g1_i4.p1  ORF type:complete len:254 (+),score=29.75 c19976_g1_i4:37-798(+)
MATREQNKLDKAVLRKYERFERIGIGAYGACWKAVCKKTAKIVAVKKLFDPFANREDGRRTCIEVMLVQTVLNHPNIIKLLNVLKAENEADLYLVYEYMDTDLRSVIRAVPQILQEIHKQYIAYQLFAALNFMHSSGVLYCGLKPHNILINTDCEIKLTDFGNARLIDSTSNEMGFIAARWYHSPEQLLGGTKTSQWPTIVSRIWLASRPSNSASHREAKPTRYSIHGVARGDGDPSRKASNKTRGATAKCKP